MIMVAIKKWKLVAEQVDMCRKAISSGS